MFRWSSRTTSVVRPLSDIAREANVLTTRAHSSVLSILWKNPPCVERPNNYDCPKSQVLQVSCAYFFPKCHSFIYLAAIRLGTYFCHVEYLLLCQNIFFKWSGKIKCIQFCAFQIRDSLCLAWLSKRRSYRVRPFCNTAFGRFGRYGSTMKHLRGFPGSSQQRDPEKVHDSRQACSD